MNWALVIVFGIPWLLLGMRILESDLMERAEKRKAAREGSLAPVRAQSPHAAAQAALRSRRNSRM